MIFDMDEAIQKYDATTNPREWLSNYCLMQEPVLQSFMRNEGFRKQFYQTLLEIGCKNFDYETVRTKLKEWKEIYEEQLLINHQRFFNEGYGKRELDEDFIFIDDFFARRKNFIEQAIEEMKTENGE